MKRKKDIALVYMVAGLSKRFGGKLKWLAKVGPNGETLIEYSLNQALPAGFTKIIFVVGEKTEKPFKEKFGESYKGIPIYYTKQEFDTKARDRPWGTVDALCSAKQFIDCPFVVCNGDDIYGENTFRILVNHLKKEKTNATVGYKLRAVLFEEGSVNRGIIELDSKSNVKSITEVFNITKMNLESKGLSLDTLCSMNLFGLHPNTLDLLHKVLIKFKKKYEEDRTIECLLPNELSKLIKEGKIIMHAYSTNDKWFGITNPEDEEKVREQLKEIEN